MLGIMESLPEQISESIREIGLDPSLPPDLLRIEMLAAIANLDGKIRYAPDEQGWTVTLLSPVLADFRGLTLERALAWCLNFLSAPEFGTSDDFS
jgi:hypothetical protein